MSADNKASKPQPPGLQIEEAIMSRSTGLAEMIAPIDEPIIKEMLTKEIAKKVAEIAKSRANEVSNINDVAKAAIMVQAENLIEALSSPQTVNENLNNEGFEAEASGGSYERWSEAINALLEKFKLGDAETSLIDRQGLILFFSLKLLQNRSPQLNNVPRFNAKFGKNNPDQPLLNMLYLLKNMGVLSESDIDKVGAVMKDVTVEVWKRASKNDVFDKIGSEGDRRIDGWIKATASFVESKIGFVGQGLERRAFLGMAPDSNDVKNSFYCMSSEHLSTFVSHYFNNRNIFDLPHPPKPGA